MYISLHSFAQKILYPWSHTKRPVHDWHELDEIARIWAKKTYFASNGKFYYEVIYHKVNRYFVKQMIKDSTSLFTQLFLSFLRLARQTIT